MTILVIDQNPADQDLIARNLHHWGYPSVKIARSLAEAAELLAFNDPSATKSMFELELIIIDTGMRDRALEFVKKLDSSIVYQDIPILAIAEGSRQERMSAAFAYGAHDFLSKPIATYELKSRVRSCLKLKYEIDRRQAREKELIEATHQLSDLNQILSKLSLIDSLTGIPNRRCFDDTLGQEWRRAQRHGGELTVIMIDIDHFKLYNDHYGHQMGDRALTTVARSIQDELRRPGDLLSRYGGEEFSIILPNTNAHQAESLCRKITQAVERAQIPHEKSKTSDYVTISMGVSSADPGQFSGDQKQLIEQADIALYESKQNGRNRYTVFTPDMHSGKGQPA